jgi:hypothetical protein
MLSKLIQRKLPEDFYSGSHMLSKLIQRKLPEDFNAITTSRGVIKLNCL